MKKLIHVQNRTIAILITITLCMGILLPFGWRDNTALAVSQNITLSVVKDKYLDKDGGHDNWTVNNAGGTTTYLYVGYSSVYQLEQSAFSFDLSGVPGPITSATLRLYAYSSAAGSKNATINIYGSNNDSWTETDPTVPSKDVALVTNQTTVTTSYAENNFDLTASDTTHFLESQRTGDHVATLVLSPVDTSSDNESSFVSSEDGQTGYRPQLIITYTQPSASLSSSALTETNINGASVNLTLDAMTFADSTLDKSNFTINGAPFTVSGVSYTDANHCVLTLAYGGADFDNNKSFSVSVAGAELATGSNTTTLNTLSVTATNDVESLSLSGSASEGSEDGAVITATISGGQYSSTITPANWTLSNLPAGVTKGAVTRADNTHVQIALSGNATEDYDTNITNVTVSCTAAEYVDSTGGGSISSGSGFTLTATNDAESLSLSGSAAEGSEDGAMITASISGGQFADTVTPSNWTVSNLPAGVTKGAITRVDNTHVHIALSGNATKDYDSNITNVTVSCTTAEYTDSTGGGTISSGSGFVLTATNDAESLSLSGSATEGAEDGAVITTAISGGTFADTITPANWTVSNLPGGVTMGSVVRSDNTHVDITLSGNATVDYDTDITNVTVSCTAAEYADSLGGGIISASSGFTLTAVIEEGVQLSASPALTESNIDGGTADITLVGMTFTDTVLDKSNFIINGAPFTVSSVSFTDDTHCKITLAYSGGDFDSNKSFSVTVAGAELSLGSDFTTNSVDVTAVNDAESLSLSGSIAEGSEDGAVITAAITDGTFTGTITPANWTVSNLPAGVTKGAVTRVDDNHVAITLSGNSRVDYDSDITNVSVSCTAGEYADSTGGGSLMGMGVTFTANNDAESLSLSGGASEGSEDGAVITVAISGGTFADAVTPSNWVVTGLPDGVTKGTVSRTDSHHVTIALSGNATADYDASITNVTVTCGASEYNDSTGGSLTVNNGFTLTAVNDAESLSLSGSAAEGSEDGAVITATISGGQFASMITPADWTVSNLPSGVTKGAVTRVDDHHISITLSGNAVRDYDTDITNVTVSCTAAEYIDSTGGGSLTANTGVTLTANNDTESLSISGDGSISEGAENGEIITATISGGQFASTITPADWTVANLPVGVTKGAVTRVDDHHVTIALSGNATKDYDSNITDVSVTCTASEYIDSTGGGSLSATGVTITANNDTESLSISDDGLITEGHENGEIITAAISGGQLADIITPANWTVSGLPGGVTKGTVTRVDDHTVTIALSGDATEDYDTNITGVSVTCTASEYIDSTGGGSLSATGITLTAIVEPEAILSTPVALDERNISGATVNIMLKGMTFADASLDKANFTARSPFAVSGVSYTDPTHCTLTIAYSGADMDSGRYLDIIIAGNELSAGIITKSNRLDVSATNDPESLSITDDGLIAEGRENGEVITSTITGGTFAETINPVNWTISNLPSGVIKGSVTRIDGHTVAVALAGNSNRDYDSDITNVSVYCTADEYADSTGGGALSASGITITAVNDAETLHISDDGMIAEGAENGEVITATISGGTFADTINPANWTISNLPSGITKGAVTRIDGHTVLIALSGSSSRDYDSDITNVSVSCSAAEYSDNAGGGALSASGITLSAVNDAETLHISDDGMIAEGAENAEVITATISGGQFADTINPANWTVSGLPSGVTKGAVTRNDGHTVTVALAGNSNRDYDSDITNITVSCSAAEYSDNAGGRALSASGITLSAVNDAEALHISDGGQISEGHENGEVITAAITGGQFTDTINPANWTVSGLPSGVSKGMVRRVDGMHVSVTLSGNARWDYDKNINISVTCTAAEYTDNIGGGDLTASGVMLKAINDPEYITVHDDGKIAEGAEGGEIITVSLTGGQFASSLDPGAWKVENLPAGVSMGSVTRFDDHTVQISLSGNATVDYDEDITNVSVTCDAGQYVSGTQPLTAMSGVVLTANAETKPSAQPTLAPQTTAATTISPEPSATPSPSQTPDGNTRTITGILLDSSGNPMAGYIVELHSDPITTVTDANGCYTFYNVEYTDHTLIAKTPEGAEIASFDVSFSPGDEFASTTTKSGANITYTHNTASVVINVKVAADRSSAAISEVSSVSNTETDSSIAWWIWVVAVALAGLVALLVIALVKRRKNTRVNTL